MAHFGKTFLGIKFLNSCHSRLFLWKTKQYPKLSIRNFSNNNSFLVNELDSIKNSGKLKKKLEATPKKIVGKVITGKLAANEEDFSDKINEILASKVMLGIFKGLTDVSLMIEIKETHIIGDGNNITALWTSQFLEKFINDIKNTHGINDANKMSLKITSYITKRLQDNESIFRTQLMKSIDFKRVPR